MDHAADPSPPPAAAVAAAAAAAPARRAPRVASVRTHLVLLALAVLLPAIAFAGVVVVRLAGAERERIEARAQEAAQEVAAAVDRGMQDVLATARLLAADEALAPGGDLGAFHRRAATAARLLDANVTVRDAASRQRVNSGVPWGQPLPAGTALSREDAEVARTGAPAFSNLYRGIVDQRWLVAVVVPVPPPPPAAAGAAEEEAAPRFLSVALPAARVQRVLDAHSALPAGQVAGVLDRAGVFIARTVDPAEAVGKPAATYSREGAATGPPGDADTVRGRGTSREGEPSVVARRVSAVTGWRVGVVVPEAALRAPLRAALAQLAAAGLGALALSLLIASLLGERIAGAIGALSAAAGALRRDEPVPAIATPLREANEVGAALAGAARDLRDVRARRETAESALRLTDERFRVALLNAPIIAYTCDRELRYTWIANPHPDFRAAEVLGRRDDELATAEDAEGARALMAFKRGVVEAGRGARGAFSWRGADGRARHYDVTAEPLRDGSGAVVGATCAALDVTAHAEAAAEREGLLRRLEGERARLAALLEAVPVGIVMAEAPSGRIVAGNARNEEVFGHPVRRTAGAGRYAEDWVGFHADGRRVASAEYPLARALTGEERPELEMLYPRPDGRRVWLRVVGAPVRGPDDAVVGAVAAVLDVDRERRALEALRVQERRQRLLIHELNHRVKNTLASVQSIAAQTLRPGRAPEEARAALQSRLFALAAAHTVLTRQSWEEAELREVLEGAVGPHMPADEPGRVRLEGPPVLVPPRAALALSLAAHELATNAAKHGALSAPGGRVAVRWEVEAEGPAAPRLRLTWTERGGPPVAGRPAARGFGTRLLERGLAADLRGTVRLEFPPEGVACAIEAPLLDPAADMLEPVPGDAAAEAAVRAAVAGG